MPIVKDICRHVRSKNAGPFWVTIDLFFKDASHFEKYSEDSALSGVAIARVVGVEPAKMKRFVVPSLFVVKYSYPRALPQGGTIERDLHSGQQFVPIMFVPLSES